MPQESQNSKFFKKPRVQSQKEQKIRQVTQFYYSRPEIQKAILSFSKNRETIPRYFEGFGKRPDTLEYKGDIFELVKKGATSFHCSEELWKDPLKVKTGMDEKQLNELRKGWDLLLDIDSKYLDYSKIMAQLIVKLLKFHGVKNIGIKFSGSKGFHIIVPWKSFPKKIYNTNTSDMFPEWPRIITKYVNEMIKEDLIETITDLTRKEKGISKYVKDFQAPKEVMPDLILVSPRHLFRMPYSLHEKTRLASRVITLENIENFQPKDADPLKLSESDIVDFISGSEEGEASELLREALDWNKSKNPEQETHEEKTFKPINIKEISSGLSEIHFPPSIRKILKGMKDGKKRALFILLNFFRSIGLERKELEEKIYSWNKKNEVPLPLGYIKAQLSWAYRHKSVLPPNFDKDYYKGIAVTPTDEEKRYKNPVNYTIKKFMQESYSKKSQSKVKKKNKKKQNKKAK